MKKKNILILIAEGFEEIEVIVPVDIWRRAGYNVALTSISNSLEVRGQQGVTIKADTTIFNIDIEYLDLLFIPGGASYKLFNESKECHQIVKKFIELNKYIAAICAAPLVLSDYLSLKNATCYPSFKEYIANWHDQSVVIDLPFITSQGPGTSFELAYQVIEIFENKEKSDHLKKEMIYKFS